jgi:hypothetical protein
MARWLCFTGRAAWPTSHRRGDPLPTNYNRPPEPSARRAVAGRNRLRATPYAASRPRQEKRTIHVLQNRTSLKTRNSGPAEALTQVRFYGLKDMTGAVLSAQDAFLVLRGLKTLTLRMDRHCANAQGVAEFLAAHPKVSAVHFPGLPGFPQYELAQRQMAQSGGMIAFELKDGIEAGRRFMNALDAVHPGGQPRRRRKPGPASGEHDALLLRAGGTRRTPDRRRPCQVVDRTGGPSGSARRFAPGFGGGIVARNTSRS